MKQLLEGKAKNEKTTFNKVKFTETKIGHFLAVYAPLELAALYLSIDDSKTQYAAFKVPEIESICERSNNPYCKKPIFRLFLIEYKKYKLRPPEPAEWKLEEAVHYAKYANVINLSLALSQNKKRRSKK